MTDRFVKPKTDPATLPLRCLEIAEWDRTGLLKQDGSNAALAQLYKAWGDAGEAIRFARNHTVDEAVALAANLADLPALLADMESALEGGQHCKHGLLGRIRNIQRVIRGA